MADPFRAKRVWLPLPDQGCAQPQAGPRHPPDDGTYTYTDRWGDDHELPLGVDYGWDHLPGQTWIGKLLMDKAAAVPAGIGARAVEAAYRETGLLDEVATQYRHWTENLDCGRPRGERFHLGALTPEAVDFLAARGYPAETAAISLGDAQYAHFLRDLKTTQLPDWLSRELPDRLAKPLAVLWDKQGLQQGKPPALIYVFHAPGTGEYAKLVVEIGYRAKDRIAGKRERILTNAVTTAGLVPAANLRDPNLYELVAGQ